MTGGAFSGMTGGLSPLRLTCPPVPQSGDRVCPEEWIYGMDCRFDQAADNSGIVASKLYCRQYFNPYPDSQIASLGLRVIQNVTTTKKYAWGCYADDGSGRPSFTSLLCSTGAQTVATGAGQTLEVVQTNLFLPYGYFWTAWITNTALLAGAGTEAWNFNGMVDNGAGWAMYGIPLGRTTGAIGRPDGFLRYDYAWSDATPLPVTSPGAASRNNSNALTETLQRLPALHFVY